MDMKKILQAFDGAATKPVAGVNDMKKFLSVVAEGAKVDRMVSHIKASEKKAGKSDKEAEDIAWATANKRGYLDNKNKKNESIIASFEAGSIGGDTNEFLIAADNIQDEVMAQVEKIKINADEALLRDMMDKFNAFMTAYHAVGKDILQPDLFDNTMGESVNEMDSQGYTGSRDKKSSSKYGSRDDYELGHGKEYTSKAVKAKDVAKKAGPTLDKAMKKAHAKESLSFKDYAALVEAKNKVKGADGKACWDGYKYAGTEKGKDKCVKVKK